MCIVCFGGLRHNSEVVPHCSSFELFIIYLFIDLSIVRCATFRFLNLQRLQSLVPSTHCWTRCLVGCRTTQTHGGAGGNRTLQSALHSARFSTSCSSLPPRGCPPTKRPCGLAASLPSTYSFPCTLSSHHKPIFEFLDAQFPIYTFFSKFFSSCLLSREMFGIPRDTNGILLERVPERLRLGPNGPKTPFF